MEFYYPYIQKQYENTTIKFLSYIISPDNKHIVIESINNASNTMVLLLFKINCGGNPSITYACDLLTLSMEDELYGYVWSATGNYFICEYKDFRKILGIAHNGYHIVYFNMNENYKRYNLFDNEYKWEHMLTFTNNDKILFTEYNMSQLRVFMQNPITKKYAFKTELHLPDRITNLYATEDKKVIVSLYSESKAYRHSRNIIKAYQLTDDFSLVYLNESRIDSRYFIYKFEPFFYQDYKYLLCYLTDGINIDETCMYIYDLYKNTIVETINFSSYGLKITMVDRYDNYILLSRLYNGSGNYVLFNILTKTYYPLDKKYSLINKCFYDKPYSIYKFDGNAMTLAFKLLRTTDSRDFGEVLAIENIKAQCQCSNDYIIVIENNRLSSAINLNFCKQHNFNVIFQLLDTKIPVELIHKITDFVIY